VTCGLAQGLSKVVASAMAGFPAQFFLIPRLPLM
jgi:hypothetical protein